MKKTISRRCCKCAKHKNCRCLENAEGEVLACSMYQPNRFWKTWYGLRKLIGFPAKSKVLVGYTVADSNGNIVYEDRQELDRSKLRHG